MINFIKAKGLENTIFFLGISVSLLIAGIYLVNYLAIIVSILFLIGFINL